MDLRSVVEGETARLVIPLFEDGVALDATGFTVTDLLLTDRDGNPIDTTGDFGWVLASAGTVYYDPDSADFVAERSPYRVRVKVTDGGGKVRIYPNNSTANIPVLPQR